METARQLALDLYTPMEGRLVIDQMRYRKPIAIVKSFFDYFMLIRPQEPIRITPVYPTGWIAEVVSEDKVWTVECDRGEIRLTRVADLCGHAPNGGFIVAAEEDITDMWNEYQQPCQYSGISNDFVTCVDLCNDDDDHDFLCDCCPWQKRSLNAERMGLH